MPLQIVRGNIAELHADCIVRPVEPGPEAYCVRDLLSDAAGAAFMEECSTLGEAVPGEIRVTGGGNLPCWQICHVCVPSQTQSKEEKTQVLTDLYGLVLRQAEENHCRSVAVPFLTPESDNFTDAEQLDLAVAVIKSRVLSSDLLIYLVVDSAARYVIDRKIGERAAEWLALFPGPDEEEEICMEAERFAAAAAAVAAAHRRSPEEVCRMANEPADYLKRAASAENAGVPRHVVLGFAAALEMSPERTAMLLRSAGFDPGEPDRCQWLTEHLRASYRLGVFDLNRILFAFGVPQLGL